MKRKLVKQGAATMMVSLPAKWIKQQGLDKGDEIDVDEKENKLVISLESPNKKKEIVLEIKEENKANLIHLLTHLYRRGFDKIELKGTDQEIVKKIRNEIDNLLLGFELTEKTDKSCVIENISEPSESKYGVMLKKVFMLIKETQEITLNDAHSSKFANFDEIQKIKNLCDKFILFCRRLIMKRELEEDKLLEWELLTFLMHIEHTYYYLYEYAAENKVKVNNELKELLREAVNYFEIYKDAYYEKEIKFVHKIWKLKSEYQFGRILKAIEKSEGKNAVIGSYLREIFRLIQVGTSPILAEVLEKSNQSTSA